MKGKYPFRGIFSVTAIAIFTYLFFQYPYSLGGSITLGILIGAIILLDMMLENSLPHFASVRTILITLMGFNFLSYWETSGKEINIVYMAIWIASAMLFVSITLSLWGVMVNNEVTLNEKDQNTVKEIRQIFLLSIGIVGLIFSMCTGGMVFFIKQVAPQIYDSSSCFRISYLSLGALLCFFVVSYIYLLKIKNVDIKSLFLSKYLNLNITKDKMKVMRTYVLITLAFVIIVGSTIEMARGMWIMWIETLLFTCLMFLVLWKILSNAVSEEIDVSKA